MPIAAPRPSRNTGGMVQNTMNTAYPPAAPSATSTEVAQRLPDASGRAKQAATTSAPVAAMCHRRSPTRSELRQTSSTKIAAQIQTTDRIHPACVTDAAPTDRNNVGNQIWLVLRKAMVKYTTTISQTRGLRIVSATLVVREPEAEIQQDNGEETGLEGAQTEALDIEPGRPGNSDHGGSLPA